MHIKDAYICPYKTVNEEEEENRVIETRYNCLHTKQVKVKNKWVTGRKPVHTVLTPGLHFLYTIVAGCAAVMEHYNH